MDYSLKQKTIKSLFWVFIDSFGQITFQFVIAIKRYLEETGKGWVEELEHGWSFGSAGGL